MRHDEELREVLAAVRRRWRMATVSTAIGRTAAAAAALIAGVLALDRWTAVGDATVAVLWIGALAAAAVVGVRAVLQARRAPDAVRIARFIEEQCPELGDVLASAAESADAGRMSALRDLLLADAAARTRDLDLNRVVSGWRVRRAAFAASAAVVVLVAILAAAVGPGLRTARAAVFHLWPPLVEIDVRPGDATVVAGEALRIVARLRGIDELPAAWRPVLRLSAEAGERSVEMEAGEDGFAFEVPAVRAAFRYSVAAGRAVSAEYLVTTRHPPAVKRIDVHYRFPAFTGLPPRTDEDGGDVYAPAGTRVRLEVHADKPIASGAIVLADGTRVELADGAEGALEAALVVSADDSYRVTLSDVEGLASAGDTEYFIRVMDDRPPDVRILRPASDRQVTPLEEVTIEARAEDDFGIERFDLVYSVRGGPERSAPFAAAGPARVRTGTHVLHLEDLDVQPGDFVTYYARARDVSRAKRSTEVRSDIFFLEVRPFSEEFVAAQSQAMGAGGGAFADLSAAQKEIIVATWKLERRAVAGRSAQDVQTIARAQGELKARAAQAAQQARGFDLRRRFRTGGQPAGEEPPLALAAAAMGRAQAALEAADPAAALPHEMEALSQLLKADAEARRRQVTSQQAAAGGGRGRQSQDLSALFDRELQRQQQTSYETPNSVEDHEQHAESEALDQVRELARRQDELARRQRELARAGLGEEELKRQLERLTREQSELRQQAEELSQRLAQRRQQAQGAAGRSGDAEAGGLREAAEDMREAARSLRRQDPDAASDRSARAADRLRELERRLERASPDHRRRALGDLQLESSEIARAQGQLAAEARRLGGAAPGEAENDRRRLAGEKDRLADRVGRLEGAIRELQERADGEQRTALDAAADDLARERLVPRMRDAAGGWREAGTDPDALRRLAEEEQRIAGTLDRVAGHVAAAGGGADAEAHLLSEQLARVRDLRERLDEVERQAERLARGGEAGELERLQEQYARELHQARELIDRLGSDDPALGQRIDRFGGSSGVPSAPGTEAFKQDYSRWEVLRRDVSDALDRYETAVTAQLVEKHTRDRLAVGAGDQLPEQYRRLVARYYEALAGSRR